MFFKRGVLKNFIKKRLQHRFFPVNIAKKEQFYQKRLQRNSGEYCEILKTAISKKNLRNAASLLIILFVIIKNSNKI